MSAYDLALLIGLLVALALSAGNGRAWLWLLAAAASFVASTIYWRTGLPYAPFIGGLCDAAVCLGVYFFAKKRWEMMVYRLFQLSVLVNFVYLSSTIGIIGSQSHNAYSAILEAITWAALFWIGGSGALQHLGVTDAPLRGAWRGLHRALLPLYRNRKTAPFHKAHS